MDSYWILILLILAVFIAGIILLARWHARTFEYICLKCGAKLSLTGWKDFISPVGGDQKYVHCPNCGRKGWARIVRR